MQHRTTPRSLPSRRTRPAALVTALALAFAAPGGPSAAAAPLQDDATAPRFVVAEPMITRGEGAAGQLSRILSDVVIDDLDVRVCIRAPCPSFTATGPESGWLQSSAGDVTYAGHAYYTYAGDTWISEDQNNQAEWLAELPDDGLWEVCAYIPRVNTGRADTTRARYQVHNALLAGSAAAPGAIPYVELDHTKGPGWFSLGTYAFDSSEYGPYGWVTLSDVTPDWDGSTGRKTVLFDAVKWTQGAPCAGGSGGGGAVSVDAYLRGRSDGAVIPVGESVEHCYRITPVTPVNIRYIYGDPDGSRTLVDGRDDGTGACFASTTNPPAGRRTIRVEAWDDAWTRLTDSDETFFDVVVVAPPPTPVPPTAVLPTAIPPTAVPATPPPDARWVAVIVPGYGNAIPYTRIENPAVHPAALRDLEDHLERRGVPTKTCFYDWTKGNDTSANTLSDCIAGVRSRVAPAPAKIALISWSNGGLVTRALLQSRAPARVALLVMIAPPNKGAVDMYPLWAGGHIDGLPWLMRVSAEIAYGVSTGCGVPLIGNSVAASLCRYAANRALIRSVGELVPVEERFLTVEQDGVTRMLSDAEIDAADRNDWLLRLNESASTLRSAVAGGNIVIVRGTGQTTAHTVRVNGNVRLFPVWRNGTFIAVGRNPSGDELIRLGRAGLLDYETVDFNATHVGLIARAEREVIFPRMGLQPVVAAVAAAEIEEDAIAVRRDRAAGADAALQGQDESARGLWVVAATSGPFVLIDGRGRRAGRYADGQVASELPGVRAFDAGNAVHLYFDAMPSDAFTIRFDNPGTASIDVAVTFIDVASGAATWRHDAVIAPGGRIDLPDIAPSRPPRVAEGVVYLPMAMREFGWR